MHKLIVTVYTRRRPARTGGPAPAGAPIQQTEAQGPTCSAAECFSRPATAHCRSTAAEARAPQPGKLAPKIPSRKACREGFLPRACRQGLASTARAWREARALVLVPHTGQRRPLPGKQHGRSRQLSSEAAAQVGLPATAAAPDTMTAHQRWPRRRQSLTYL